MSDGTVMLLVVMGMACSACLTSSVIGGIVAWKNDWLDDLTSKLGVTTTDSTTTTTTTTTTSETTSPTSTSTTSTDVKTTVDAKLGKKIWNNRMINGKSVDPENKGRFYTACYGPDDGYGGKGAFGNTLAWGPPIWSIALPRGRKDGKDVVSKTSETLTTTDHKHPLVAAALRAKGKWSFEDEYRFMKDEKNRPKYLMVLQDGTQMCVRVDDKCEGCYWGDRGIDGNKGFDLDVYLQHSDATCWKFHPNQYVEIYESETCNKKK